MRTLGVTVGCLFAVSAWTFAAEQGTPGQGKKADASKAFVAPLLEQKTCPVSGKPISKKEFIEFEGRKVYFCCGACPAKFKESPEKYQQI